MADTPEEVAYKLLLAISDAEHKHPEQVQWSGADRQWILDTYAECLETVRGQRTPRARPPTRNERDDYAEED